MSRIVEIYKPTFELFHGQPVILFQEPKHTPRVVVNLYQQYTDWLNAWTDPFRNKHAPSAAFWETPGPAICRALRHVSMCAGLFFEYETDRRVAYRWLCRKPESPVKWSNDHYVICPVVAEGNVHNGEGRVTVTLPTDEDIGFYFHAHTMKDWLREPPKHAFVRGRNDETCRICEKDPRNICHEVEPKT